MPPNQNLVSEPGGQTGSTNLVTLETIDEQPSDPSQATPVVNVNYENVTATYRSTTNEVEVHIPYIQVPFVQPGQEFGEGNVPDATLKSTIISDSSL